VAGLTCLLQIWRLMYPIYVLLEGMYRFKGLNFTPAKFV
jgi:hypothetical protein